MADRAAYEYRAFLIQVSDGLLQKDLDGIVFLQELPAGLAKESPLNVLVQLEMRGIISATKPEDLAKLLKEIGRHDLAKKVRDFAKKQRKGRSTISHIQRLDQLAVNLSASLKLTLIQCKILLEQVENVKEEAEALSGFKRVEEVVAEAQTLISEHLQRKLMYASRLLQENTVHTLAGYGGGENERDSPPSSPETSPSSLEFTIETAAPSEPATLPASPPPHTQLQRTAGGMSRPPVRYVRESEVRAVAGNLRSQSLPQQKGNPSKQVNSTGASKQPLVPPPGKRLPGGNERATTGDTATTLSAPVVEGGVRPGLTVNPRLEQAAVGGGGEEIAPATQMVTGKPNAQKPIPPPKPKHRLNKKAVVLQADARDPDQDSLYDDVSTCSFTGDSGFGDSKEFLKVPLCGHYEPPHPLPQASEGHCTGYAALEVTTLHAGYYKSLERVGIQEVQYAPQVPPVVTASNPTAQYMNIANKGKLK